jgi:hypothetical protein
MKKYITLFALLIASISYVNAQSASQGRVEKIRSQKKQVKFKGSHFETRKPDKKMKHNSTLAFKSVRISQCHPEGYSMKYRSPYKMQQRTWKRTKNKTFGTYTMK